MKTKFTVFAVLLVATCPGCGARDGNPDQATP